MMMRRILQCALGVVLVLSLSSGNELGAKLSDGVPGWASVSVQRLGSQGPNFYRWKQLLLENANGVSVGCQFKDCIPTIYEPSFSPSGDVNDWLEPDDRVIGLDIGDSAKAYPLKVLNYHEVVNDHADDESILVTYCPLCGSAVGFKRRLEGTTFKFGVSGLLHHSNLVLYDHETESFWDQITGEGIAGPHTSDKLTRIPLDVVRWGDWRLTHPDTLVLERQTGPKAPDYETYPYNDYRTSDSVYYGTTPSDDRLHPKTDIIGVSIQSASAAYPDRVLRSQAVLQDRLGETPIAIIRHPKSGQVRAFDRRVDGETLTLDWREGQLIDLETGSEWSLSGQALNGAHEGTQLATLSTTPSFWFAWAAYHPNTTVFEPTSASPPSQAPWSTSAWLGYAGLAAIATLVGLMRLWHRVRRTPPRNPQSG